MTSCKKVARLACAILLLSLPLFGQYQGAPSPGIVDGTERLGTATNAGLTCC
jgi:hypothetical protein